MTEQKMQIQKKDEGRIVRILAKDIEGKMKVYAGLTKIKGVSWSLSCIPGDCGIMCNLWGIC